MSTLPIDVEVSNHGSLYGLNPLSETGEEWLAENLPEDTQCLGNVRFCEWRYIEPIVEGMQNDGLIIG